MPTVDARFKLRGGLAVDLAALDEVPLRREMVVELDNLFTTGEFKAKVGDGVTHYNDLPYLQTGSGLVEGPGIAIEQDSNGASVISSKLSEGNGITIEDDSSGSKVISSNLGSLALDGTADDYADLPAGFGSGDDGATYYNFDDGLVYIWDGTAWPAEGGGIRTSSFQKGAAFPTAPMDGDTFYRTDLNLLCYFDGARWLTVTQYERSPDVIDGFNPLGGSNLVSGNASGRWMLHYADGVWLEKIALLTFKTTSGANYWSFQMSARTLDNIASNIGSAVSTAADTQSNWVDHTQDINAELASSVFQIQMVATRTGSGIVYCLPRIIFRRIVV